MKSLSSDKTKIIEGFSRFRASLSSREKCEPELQSKVLFFLVNSGNTMDKSMSSSGLAWAFGFISSFGTKSFGHSNSLIKKREIMYFKGLKTFYLQYLRNSESLEAFKLDFPLIVSKISLQRNSLKITAFGSPLFRLWKIKHRELLGSRFQRKVIVSSSSSFS